MCRSYKPGTLNDLAPGYQLGHSCIICSQALQATSRGILNIKAGGRPFCNQCAFQFIKQIGPQNLAGVIFSPEAQAQVDRMIAQMRNQKEKATA